MKKIFLGKALFLAILFKAAFFILFTGCQSVEKDNLENVVIVIGDRNNSSESVAAQVLMEEIEKRTGFRWEIVTKPEGHRNVIYLSSDNRFAGIKLNPEGYNLKIIRKRAGVNVFISGSGGRGVLFGVGKLLRMVEWGKGNLSFPQNTDITSSPAYPMRGHQIGYRATANSYDAWTPEIYDQYIRELALFGTNSIENIPFHSGNSPHMKINPDVMNIRLSKICEKYDLDYWVWTPSELDLADKSKRGEAIAKHKVMYDACPRLDGVFFPGGDPGNNHPKLILPYLEELSKYLKQKHPRAKIWLSLQSFDNEEIDYVFSYLRTNMPDWLGGLVNGPGSPPIAYTRERLPEKYKLRHYPDITHSCRCQYPVSWWDPALARTLGRECPNPQPVYYSLIHNTFAPLTDGFISYSDGMHDDLNKIIWSAKGWDPDADIQEILKDYARFFFRPDLAGSVADGILALENNWIGALAQNGSVETTLRFWKILEGKAPELARNWRWQLFQLRSKYDAYIRNRLIYERNLEKQVNHLLSEAAKTGADTAIRRSLKILNLAVTVPASPELRNEIEASAKILFNTIGFQTSVKKYNAIGLNRGAIIDYLDLPMNNRLWLEDEFAKILKSNTEEVKLKQISVICNWENPGKGSYYDDLGTLDRSPHLVRGEGLNSDPLMERNPNPGYWYWEEGFNRLRLSWLVSMDNPVAVVYENLDRSASYDARVTGYRVDQLRMNGEWVKPFNFSQDKGAIIEYHVPAGTIKSGKLTLNWGDPEITEVWLIKK